MSLQQYFERFLSSDFSLFHEVPDLSERWAVYKMGYEIRTRACLERAYPRFASLVGLSRWREMGSKYCFSAGRVQLNLNFLPRGFSSYLKSLGAVSDEELDVAVFEESTWELNFLKPDLLHLNFDRLALEENPKLLVSSTLVIGKILEDHNFRASWLSERSICSEAIAPQFAHFLMHLKVDSNLLNAIDAFQISQDELKRYLLIGSDNGWIGDSRDFS